MQFYNWFRLHQILYQLQNILGGAIVAIVDVTISLLSLLQEAAFRKVVQTTMVRDRQHGPVIELNRIQVSLEFS